MWHLSIHESASDTGLVYLLGTVGSIATAFVEIGGSWMWMAAATQPYVSACQSHLSITLSCTLACPGPLQHDDC